MKKALLFLALIILLFAAISTVKQKSSSENRQQSPTTFTQEHVTPTVVVTRLTSQIQGQAKTVPLTISEPANNIVTTSSTITVKGKTVGNADVSVNEKDLKADAQGNFSTTITLDEGENIIAVLAVDQRGNFVEQDLLVMYNTGENYE